MDECLRRKEKERIEVGLTRQRRVSRDKQRQNLEKREREKKRIIQEKEG